MTVNQLRRMVLMIFAITAMATAYGQQGQWAAADNPTAKFMIDAERQWAEAACTHNKIAQKILETVKIPVTIGEHELFVHLSQIWREVLRIES